MPQYLLLIYFDIIFLTKISTGIVWVRKVGNATFKFNFISLNVACFYNCDVNKIRYFAFKICPINADIIVNERFLYEKFMNEIMKIQMSSCGKINMIESINKLDELGDCMKKYEANLTQIYNLSTTEYTHFTQNWKSEIIIQSFSFIITNDCISEPDFVYLIHLMNITNFPYYELNSENKYRYIMIMKNQVNYIPIDTIYFTNNSTTIIRSRFSTLESILKLEFFYTPICDPNYFYSGCWYLCNNDTNSSYCPYLGPPRVCLGDWVENPVLYIDEKNPTNSEEIIECNILDSCISMTCPTDQTCVSFSNASYGCIDNKLSVVYNGLIYLPGETKKCTTTNDDLDKKLIFRWIFPEHRERLHDYMIENREYLKLNDSSGNVIAYTENLSMICQLCDFTKKDRYNHTFIFTLIAIPKKFQIISHFSFLITGEVVICYSRDVPRSFYKYDLYISGVNFSNEPFTYVGHIPLSLNYGEVRTTCCARPKEKRKQLTVINPQIWCGIERKEVSPYFAFSWNDTLPFYKVGDEIWFVLKLMTTNYTFYLSQLSGDTVLEFINIDDVDHFYTAIRKLLITPNIRGGEYEIRAVVQMGINPVYTVLEKILSVTVIEEATKAHFHRLIGYPGEYVQCITNGYPLYLIYVKITMHPTNKSVTQYHYENDFNRATIPNDIPLNLTYKITCFFKSSTSEWSDINSVSEIVSIRVRVSPYTSIQQESAIPILYQMLVLTFLFLSFIVVFPGAVIICFMFHPNTKWHIDNTKIYLNKVRKVSRYNRKMSDIVDVILEIYNRNIKEMGQSLFHQHKKNPNIEMKVFQEKLQTYQRASYTPGYVIKSEYIMQDNNLINESEGERERKPSRFAAKPQKDGSFQRFLSSDMEIDPELLNKPAGERSLLQISSDELTDDKLSKMNQKSSDLPADQNISDDTKERDESKSLEFSSRKKQTKNYYTPGFSYFGLGPSLQVI